MNTRLNKLSLLLGVAVLVAASALAATAFAAPGTGDRTGEPRYDVDPCGGLRMDEYYACHYGGWHPTPEAGDGQTAIGVNCGDLRADEFYACLSSGWRPADDSPVNVR